MGRTVADVYSVNTLGGILGSLASGFLLIRFFGTDITIAAAALLLLGLGGLLALALALPARAWRLAASLALLAVVALLAAFHPRLDTRLLSAGWGAFGSESIDVNARRMTRVLYHKEGVSSIVDVGDSGYGMRFISINAQPVATTYMPDMRGAPDAGAPAGAAAPGPERGSHHRPGRGGLQRHHCHLPGREARNRGRT